MSNNKEQFRLLRADEIQCRAQTVKSYGFSLLLYKDARCDINILNEEIGPYNWQRKHDRNNANCSVGLWDAGKSQWVWKEDTGVESYNEKEKGLASDSFKRACFNWGLGVELYTAPFIWLKPKDGEVEKDNNRYKLNSKAYFYVDHIGYNDNRQINELVIKDKDDNIRFTHGDVTESTDNESTKKDTSNNTNKNKTTKDTKQESDKSADNQSSQNGKADPDEFIANCDNMEELIGWWKENKDEYGDTHKDKVAKRLDEIQ